MHQTKTRRQIPHPDKRSCCDVALMLNSLTKCLNGVLQLVLTVGLLAVVVYLYTVVAFNFFRKFYNKSEVSDSKTGFGSKSFYYTYGWLKAVLERLTDEV
ncbi:ryanodine receptor 3-like [Nothobranchius furzeri]|uniref:ryanodine receptor 3-like n=1 Tax=Nothobranchius furzeri TaxID=105023 RepID=UPI00390489EC